MDEVGAIIGFVIVVGLFLWILSQSKPRRQRTLEEERAYQERMGQLEAEADWKRHHSSNSPFNFSRKSRGNDLRRTLWG